MFQPLTNEILQTGIHLPPPDLSGRSRDGRAVAAYQYGTGPRRISLIAGCHADEPTGPLLLRKLVCFFESLPAEHPMLQYYQWWIVPHANPDGEAANRRWYAAGDETYNLARYLQYAVREKPGDDLEYGFPVAGLAGALRPENEFIYEFWKKAGGPFQLHASLHSIHMGFGAWYLLEPAWAERATPLIETVRRATEATQFPLHDVDRQGEKGFHRLTMGFCTRPDSESMRQYFLDRGEPETAASFHPSSMESIRSLGGDCLTLVSEIPFFLLPPPEKTALTWPDPAWEEWKAQMGIWRMQLQRGVKTETAIHQAAREMGVKPVPIADQMRLQWLYVCAGLDLLYQEEGR